MSQPASQPASRSVGRLVRQPTKQAGTFFFLFFVFPPCLFPVAISVFNLTPAGGKKGLLFPLKDSFASQRRQKWEEESRAFRRGATGESRQRHRKPGPSVTFNKSLSSFSPLFPLKTVRFQRWDSFKYIPDKETFFPSLLRMHEGKYPLPHTYGPTLVWLKPSDRFEHQILSLLSPANGFPMAISLFKTGNYGWQTETPRIRARHLGPLHLLQSDLH